MYIFVVQWKFSALKAKSRHLLHKVLSHSPLWKQSLVTGGCLYRVPFGRWDYTGGFLRHTVLLSVCKPKRRGKSLSWPAFMCLWVYVNTLYGLNVGKQPYHLPQQLCTLHVPFPFHFSSVDVIQVIVLALAHAHPKGNYTREMIYFSALTTCNSEGVGDLKHKSSLDWLTLKALYL